MQRVRERILRSKNVSACIRVRRDQMPSRIQIRENFQIESTDREKRAQEARLATAGW